MKTSCLLLVVAALTSCGPSESPRTVQPGAPGEASREAEPRAPRPASAGHTAADVAFMKAMIQHHAQALVMTELVPDRTQRRDIRLLAERIEASQEAEIEQMRGWLETRGETAPSADPSEHAGHAGHAPHGDERAAHGMATPGELSTLAGARGAEFDRLFLELMIRHHEGALRMARDLLATEGAGQEPALFQLLSHIDADQRAEIARMRRMLNAPLQ